jgi:hypothetical protein
LRAEAASSLRAGNSVVGIGWVVDPPAIRAAADVASLGKQR